MTDYKILIYGYGNPGRKDDGLGNAFVEFMEAWVNETEIAGITFDSNYQLNIEDAAAIADKDLVIFADASTEDIEDFKLLPVNASAPVSFTTHAASPGYIVDLCRQIYNKVPASYLLHIKGYEWIFEEGLSDQARQNLDKALEHTKARLLNPAEMISSFKEI